jgi:hypothetical protein
LYKGIDMGIFKKVTNFLDRATTVNGLDSNNTSATGVNENKNKNAARKIWKKLI